MLLLLPSSFDEPTRKTLCSDELLSLEEQLREGQAFESLSRIWGQLRAWGVAYQHSARGTRSQGAYTRHCQLQDQIKVKIKGFRQTYDAAQAALIRLWGSGEWMDVLQELKPEHIRCIHKRTLEEEEQENFRKAQARAGVSDTDIQAMLSGIDNIPTVAFDSRSRGQRAKNPLPWIWYTLGTRNSGDSTKEGATAKEIEDRDEALYRLLSTLVALEGLQAYAKEQADAEMRRATAWHKHWYPMRQRAAEVHSCLQSSDPDMLDRLSQLTIDLDLAEGGESVYDKADFYWFFPLRSKKISNDIWLLAKASISITRIRTDVLVLSIPSVIPFLGSADVISLQNEFSGYPQPYRLVQVSDLAIKIRLRISFSLVFCSYLPMAGENTNDNVSSSDANPSAPAQIQLIAAALQALLQQNYPNLSGNSLANLAQQILQQPGMSLDPPSLSEPLLNSLIAPPSAANQNGGAATAPATQNTGATPAPATTTTASNPPVASESKAASTSASTCSEWVARLVTGVSGNQYCYFSTEAAARTSFTEAHNAMQTRIVGPANATYAPLDPAEGWLTP
ncbi:hypothetical protein V5O48_017039 [Marasmius crinis-equi]|uniref:Uncharacterized protein n=1 Tax=Marasmius crinis-equi TaxID=585013 RepID=A0ABR3EQ40_9AGAR